MPASIAHTLNQPQREALIELLCLAAATNHRYSSAEEAAMHSALQKLGWQESGMPRQFFLLEALKEAREVVDHEELNITFIATRTALFETDAEKDAVLKLIMLVLEIDGMEEDEDTFLARVQAALDK